MAGIQNNTNASAPAVICTNCDRVKIVFIIKLHQSLKLDINEHGESPISAKSHVLSCRIEQLHSVAAIEATVAITRYVYRVLRYR